MNSANAREIEQLQKQLNALATAFRESQRPKPTSWVQNNSARSGLVLITPSGGIAARSGSTISSAVCTIVNRSGSTISTGTETFTVWNMSTTAVAGNAYIGVLWTNIGWKAVWEDC